MSIQQVIIIVCIIAGWTLLIYVGLTVRKKVLAFQKGYRFALGLVAALRIDLKSIAEMLSAVRDELVFMRTMTQTAMGSAAPQTQPPVGRPANRVQFPGAPVNLRAVEPEAEMADTDQALLNQTDEELQVAQALEEYRAKGIEIEPDELPTDAVVEEA